MKPTRDTSETKGSRPRARSLATAARQPLASRSGAMVSKKKKGGAKAMDTEGDGGFNYGAFAVPTLQLSLFAQRALRTPLRE